MKKHLLFIGMGLLFALPANAANTALDGQAIFNKNCSVCHAVNPPPKTAPPIIPLASRYHQAFKTKQEGVKHIATYLKSPKKQNAIYQQAITRFGVMPTIALPEAELNAVAEWVWDQYNPNMGMGKGFGGQGIGRMRSN